MPFTLSPADSIRTGLKEVVRRQLHGANKRLQEGGPGSVHEARKSVKKVRAVVTLLQQAGTGALGADRQRLRAASQALCSVRDSDVVVATFDRLRLECPERFPEEIGATIRRRLIRNRTRVAKKAHANDNVAQAAHELKVVRRSVKGWNVPAIDALDLADILKTSYREARKAMRRARKTVRTADLHRWRKRVKTLSYQVRLIETWAPDLLRRAEAFEQLETWLGEFNDLAVLQNALSGGKNVGDTPQAAVRAINVAIVSTQRTLRRKALVLGQRLLGESPKVFARELRLTLSKTPDKTVVPREQESAVA